MHTTTLAILDFWFGTTDDPGHAQPRQAWFTKDAAFDAEIARRFGPLIEQALAGDLDDWITRPIDPLPVALLGGLGVAATSALVLMFFHPLAVTFIDLAVHLAAILIVVGSAALINRRALAPA